MPHATVSPVVASTRRPTRSRRWARGLAGILACGLMLLVLGNRPFEAEPPAGLLVERDLVYRVVGDREVRLDLYRPEGRPPAEGWPVVVAIHGGGWRGGSKEDFGKAMAPLARQGLALAVIDYRLSRGGSPSWPENRDDARRAVRWLRTHARAHGLDPRRVAALGASAGGHLAALLGTDPRDALDRVDAVVCFYAPTDLPALAEIPGPRASIATMLGAPASVEARARYEAASPIRHVGPDDPPMLLIHGEADRTIPLEQSDRMAEALARAGVPHRRIVVPEAGHGFYLTIGSRDFRAEIREFLETSWNRTD